MSFVCEVNNNRRFEQKILCHNSEHDPINSYLKMNVGWTQFPHVEKNVIIY